ncbi:hypothetical protein, partial [Candidatus Thiosymbion oneisti]|uniref:hypothetical protein n=1 Tax=Candidatus Thiosymbion oneisti TaxID=589554 RepID=UPI001A9C630B
MKENDESRESTQKSVRAGLHDSWVVLTFRRSAQRIEGPHSGPYTNQLIEALYGFRTALECAGKAARPHRTS